MPSPPVRPRADYAAAVEDLAGRVAGCLADGSRVGIGAGPLARFVDEAADRRAALAAVRVLGPDVLAPAVLDAAEVDPTEVYAADGAVVVEALRVFPPGSLGATPEAGWRDWATGQVLARWVDAAADPPDTPRPAEVPGSEDGWPRWSAWAARLAPLALPDLDSAVHEQVRRRTRALGRGAVRAMLRRDYLSAARLVRWLALASRDGHRPDLDLGVAVAHIELHSGSGPRVELETAITRRLLRCPGSRR
ncbi:hypothetical protein [Pseudonocardia acaciae]|uniref:hypothetical protein n=1 Tax=Pseudonocardia acaciae TaxID=551276 RepID=UPI00048CE73D|nr:hypothetical protein [Pseudonocardia acaciae]